MVGEGKEGGEIWERLARARYYFGEYVRVVHGWEVRAHQEPWVVRLQALKWGLLRNPLTSEGCEVCWGFIGCSVGHRTTKLLILAPPGSGKTDTMIEYVAHVIGEAVMRGRVPQVGYVSFSDDVAEIRSLAIRDTVASNEVYRMLYEGVVPDKGKLWGKKEWFVRRGDPGKKDPTMRAAGIAGGILSYRFSTMLVIDDPHDNKSVATVGQKDEVWRIWRNTIRTRVSATTPIVMICTRWAEDDLAGRVMEVEGDWHVWRTPALNEEEETYWPLEMHEGEVKGISTETLRQLRREDRASFLGQYMCLPPSAEGEIFRWFPERGAEPRPDEVLGVYQCWDTAQTEKAKKAGSYSSMVEIVKLRTGGHIAYAYRGRLSPVDLYEKMLELWMGRGEGNETGEGRWGKTPLVLVENQSSGPALVSMLQRQSAMSGYVKAVDIPSMKKLGLSLRPSLRGSADLVNRAAAAVHLFETGYVTFPSGWSAWKETLKGEMAAFPNGQYRDQVAALLIGLEYIWPKVRVGRPNPGFRLVRV